ncbi:MAG: FRG domain-containing protein [Actinomycetota bacterium]
MRTITGQLSERLTSLIGSGAVATADAIPVASFDELVREVAQLSYVNRDYLLFYRGQAEDYRNRAGASTFYPSIYRGERLPRESVALAFDVLDLAASRLCDGLYLREIDGHRDVRRRRYIQWSILQHYEVCPTPLLDLTQSLLVACSFAFLEDTGTEPYVFVFGMPYVSNRVSINSEHDLVNVRLLSICPPDALRPYFQEGYVAGTDEVTTQYDSKSELDFTNRLVAKFKLTGGRSFWGDGFRPLSRAVLYPEDDRVQWICDEIRRDLEAETSPGRVGAFLREWNELEALLMSRARAAGNDRLYSVQSGIRVLAQEQDLPERLVEDLNRFRVLRNRVVHEPLSVEPERVIAATDQLRELMSSWRSWAALRSL